MARRDSGKKAAKDGKSLRSASQRPKAKRVSARGARSASEDPRASSNQASNQASNRPNNRAGHQANNPASKSATAPARNPAGIPARNSARRSAAPRANNQWPEKRAVLFKPERSKYVRKQVETKGCVFCEALKRGPSKESLVLFANNTVLVIMNKYPYNSGHILVLPRRHEGDLTRLTKGEVDQVFEMVQRIVGFLKEVYQPAGFNVGLNLGAAAGAGIPEHLHMHIIPRWKGDTNFFPLIAQTKVVVETLEQTYDRLVPYFDAIK